MSDSFEEHMKGLQRGRAEVYDTLAQFAMERDIIKTVCRELDMPWLLNRLYDRCDKALGSRKLRLLDFREELPDFPYYLAAVKLKKRKAPSKKYRMLTVRNLLVYGLDRQECVEEYRELRRELPSDIRKGLIGLVFNIPHVPGGAVLHNGPVNLKEPGSRLSWQSQSATTALTLESLSSLCKAIRPHWQPSV